MLTIQFKELFEAIIKLQHIPKGKYFPHYALGAINGIYAIMNDNDLTDAVAADLARLASDTFYTMGMQDFQDLLKDEHDKIIIWSEL